MSGGFLCGYVAIEKPLSKNLLDENWVKENVWACGGVTYYKQQDMHVVFGFDCFHYFAVEDPKLSDPRFIMKLTQCLEVDIFRINNLSSEI